MKVFVHTLLLLALWGSVGAEETPPPGGPRDVPSDHWATQAVEELFEKGLLQGYPDGTFLGKQPLTRYEAALLLQRVIEHLNLGPELLRIDPTEELVLDLPGLVALALLENPEIKALLQESVAAQEVVPQAGALDDPMLGLDLVNMPFPSLSFDETPMSGVQIKASQKFPAAGKLGLRAEVAREGAEVAQWTYLDRINDVVRRVKQAYFDLYFIHQAIQVTEANKLLLETFVTIAETKYGVGRGLQQDVLKAQVELSRILDQLVQLKQQRDTAQARLNVLLNRPPQAPLGKPPELGKHELKWSLEELQQLALAQRPALQALEHQIQQKEFGMKLARRDLRSDYTVGMGYRFRANVPMDPVHGEDFLSLSVSANLPVYAGRKQRKRIAEMEARVEAQKARYEALRNNVYFALRDRLARLEKSGREEELFRTGIIPQAELSLESARAGYENDLVDFLTLLNNLMTLFKYQIDYYRVLTDYEKQLADLEFVVGVPLY